MDKNFEQLGLSVNFSPHARRYFDKLKAELLGLFGGQTYDEIKASENAPLLKKISDKLAQLESFVKNKKVPIVEVDNDVLQFAGAVDLPPTTDLYHASERFGVTRLPDSLVKIRNIGPSFEVFFSVLLIGPRPQVSYTYYNIKRLSIDSEIIDAIGLGPNIETDLGDIWSLLEKQGRGQAGDLLTDGRVNVFYVRDKDKNLRQVIVYWEDGWKITERSFDMMEIGNNQPRVFARSPE